MPPAYADLFARTLPFAVVGGLVSLALTTHVLKGVALSALALVAYVAMIQPVLVADPRGLRALTLPVGVVGLYALSVGAALLVLSYANGWARARSTATR